MTPDQLAKKDAEHSHQVALFAYCAMAANQGFAIADAWANGEKVFTDFDAGRNVYPLKWIHAIPNGGARGDNKKSSMIRGAMLKAEGVRSGIADVFMPFPWGRYHGLYIEMKKPAEKPKKATSKGGCSNEQIEFRGYCDNVGYEYVVCYSWIEAVRAIKIYLGVSL